MFYPLDRQVSWWKRASREDLEPHFIQWQIKGGLWTETDNFVALKHPGRKKEIIITDHKKQL